MLKHFLLGLLLISQTTPGHAGESRAPDIYRLSFQTPEGTSYSLAQHRGEVLLVNFWATWCPPCVKEMPELESLEQAFIDRPFRIVAISAGESAADLEAFKHKLDTPLTLQILLDSEGRTFTEFNLKGLPMSYLFDSEGELVEVITGAREWASEKWKARIRELLPTAP
ncbi:TlpA family protein disulfide reductase [Marinobacterium sp. D7]|uniref:TlpA family protein disulfide reductase n=1 Tax=Marinobacterium ramblicola TaxID=2849041 RepID=UPI001C2D01A9|nr:TlpA disulfide reductase family protein [Marinobacterium ramblicola]MBV1789916.1 TlpA family protein disulfide reductase [Marinobacterium ramblicola]